MQCKRIYHICYGFKCSLKNCSKLSQKTDFLAGYKRFSRLHPLTPYELRPNILWKSFKIFGRCMCVCVSVGGGGGGLGGGELGPDSSQKSPNLLKFLPQVFFNHIKKSLDNICKKHILTKIGRTQSLHFWSNFDSSFPPNDGHNRKK